MVDDHFAGWQRVGGRRLQFYATDLEIAEWLLEMTPPALGPYTVLGRERRDERLRRSMRKRLVVETSFTFPDGSTREHWPMTARAADAHSRGEVTFAARPVRPRS